MGGKAPAVVAIADATEAPRKAKPLAIDQLLDLYQPTTFSVPMHLSADGARLSLSLQPTRRRVPFTATGWYLANQVPALVDGSKVIVVDQHTGDVCHPFPVAETSWGGRWSPDGTRLAAYVEQGGCACLGVWYRETGAVQLFRDAQVRVAYDFEVPRWTPDGRAVVVPLWPIDPAESPASTQASSETLVSVLSYLPEDGRYPAHASRSSAPAPWFDRCRADIGLVDTDTGSMRRLTRGWATNCWRIAPDSHAVALSRYVAFQTPRTQHFFDLVVVPLDGATPRTVASQVPLSGFGLCLSWSPDSRRLAYSTEESRTEGPSGRLFTVPADGSGAPVDMVDDAVTDLRQDREPGVTVEWEAPCWGRDGESIFCFTPQGIWGFPGGGHAPRLLGAGLDRDLRSWLVPFAEDLGSPLVGDTIPVLTFDSVTKREGVARVDLQSGAATILVEFEKRADPLSRAMGDGAAGCILLEGASHPPEVWRIDARSGATERLYTPNPTLDGGSLGEARMIDWRALDGEVRRGALMLPPGYDGEQPLPLIVWVYGGVPLSDHLYRFGVRGLSFGDAHLLATRGYAVLWPDMPMADRDPLRQLPGLVLPAVNRAIDLGIADPQRLGLLGHSYGGYCALALLTQTTRFRAAVACSMTACDFPSAYGMLTAGGDSKAWGYAEGTPWRLGGTLWERREAYIENSPLFYLDRVRTPVLLIHGTEDEYSDAQAVEAFSALRRLGQRVELRRYRGEGHSPRLFTEPNLRDVTERVLAWFDEHLLT